MNDRMDRKDFLKYSVATGVLMAAGERTIETVLAADTIKATEVDKLTIWVLADNCYDTNIAEGKNKKRYGVVPGKSIQAQHGLSFYAEPSLTARQAPACSITGSTLPES